MLVSLASIIIDAAGIVTKEDNHLNLRKDNGLVSEVFQQHHMLQLKVRDLLHSIQREDVLWFNPFDSI